MDFSLCPYKFIFGKPKEGVHKYRLFDIAIVDVVCTIGASYLISKYFKYDFKLVLFIMFVIGIISHRLFCIETTVDKFLFR
uniref:Uncharacterized protein n=1 Tax=viral metagenome TaxID=1070528 RepID=A0A6C0D996_9ZZZZ